MATEEERIQRVQATDFNYIFLLIMTWLRKRPLIEVNNTQPSPMSSVLGAEIDEVEFEKNAGNPIKFLMESLDVMWVLGGWFDFSQFFKKNIVADALSHVDGRGGQSGIFDSIREISGNLPDHQKNERLFVQELTQIWSLVLSIFAHAEKWVSLEQMAYLVFLKNTLNYPEQTMMARQDSVAQKLTTQEAINAYEYIRSLLKKIRSFFIELGYEDRAYGLKREDWRPHLAIIQAYEQNVETGLAALHAQLGARDIPKAQLTDKSDDYRQTKVPPSKKDSSEASTVGDPEAKILHIGDVALMTYQN